MGTIGFCTLSTKAMKASKADSTTNTIATTLYWRLKYAIAPSRTYSAILIISGSPGSEALTCL